MTRRAKLLYCATLSLLVLTWIAQHRANRRPEDVLSATLRTIPGAIGRWQMEQELSVTDGVLARLRPTELLARTYRAGTGNLELFISYYSQQRAGESMHSPKNCLPGSGWEIWKHGSIDIRQATGAVQVNDFRIQNGNDRMRMIYWYQSRKRIVASEYAAKWWLLQDALFDGRTAGAIVRITVPDATTAVADAREFAALVMPEVQRCIGR